MAATLSASTPTSPSQHGLSSSNPNLAALPPLITTTTPSTRRTNAPRPPSYAKNRMSSYSNTSHASQSRSRPASHVFPIFHSSLAYALVRDFAYLPTHPLHYGPPPHTSGLSTPVSDTRRLSDPPETSWDSSRGKWSSTSWSTEGQHGNQQLPAMTFGDGPPYSEDEDLHSPVVTTSRHRKHKSSLAALGGEDGKGRERSPGSTPGRGSADSIDQDDGNRGVLVGLNGDGSETYYINEDNETADGPGGELVTYPPEQARHSLLAPDSYTVAGQRDSHFSTSIPGRSFLKSDILADSDDDTSDAEFGKDQSRYSRDYQFTIASPDEEMHGKAVALFDFTREHENELPLKEGQVIWVSYRHGQGWLVAEDPKTGESGLVPEEFVRLLREIEGGLSSLSGEVNTQDGYLSPLSAGPDAATPTQTDHPRLSGSGHSAHSSNGSNVSGEKHPPVVSTFSTSSKDLDPYPLGVQGKSAPPQVVHYDGKRGGNGNGNGNVVSTPTLSSPPAEAKREGKDGVKGTKGAKGAKRKDSKRNE